MKSIFLLLFSICLLCSCCRTRVNQTRVNNEPINNQIGEYIRRTCEENKPCEIQIKNAADFPWDKLYVFNETVEDEAISKVLGTGFSSNSPYYSRKWFFFKDNKIVRGEEHLMEKADEPAEKGNVLLAEDNPKEKYSIFGQDSMFEVSKKRLNENEFYYYLRCTNCR